MSRHRHIDRLTGAERLDGGFHHALCNQTIARRRPDGRRSGERVEPRLAASIRYASANRPNQSVPMLTTSDPSRAEQSGASPAP